MDLFVMMITQTNVFFFMPLFQFNRQFATARAKASSEAESAAFLIAPVKEYITPASKLITISTMDTANKAITLMKQSKVRHVVVADKVKNNRIAADSKIAGVISMSDVMSLVQKDERISLESLEEEFPGLNDPMSQMKEKVQDQSIMLGSEEEIFKNNVIRVGTAVLSAAFVGSFLSGSPWLSEHADLALIGIFVLGYVGIIFEEVFEFNKAAIALLMSTGVLFLLLLELCSNIM